jgi:hypothetical protein
MPHNQSIYIHILRQGYSIVMIIHIGTRCKHNSIQTDTTLWYNTVMAVAKFQIMNKLVSCK